MLKKLLILALAAAPFLPAQPANGWPTGNRHFPWDKFPIVTCIYRKQGANITPIVGMVLSTVATVQANSGFHPHSATGRPGLTLLSQTPVNGATDSAGCVTYIYKGQNFSEWVTIQSHDVATGTIYSGVNVYLGFYEWDWLGRPYQMSPYDGSFIQPMSRHPDPRHVTNVVRNSQESNYADYNTLQAFEAAADAFYSLPTGANPGRYELDLIRMSLPDGGVADNSVISPNPGDGYAFSEWMQPVLEQHMVGTEIDISNPSTIAPDGSPIYYVSAIGLMKAMGCRAGAVVTRGQQRRPIDDPYWYSISVLHFVCTHSGLSLQ
jgi:hypothetical protein